MSEMTNERLLDDLEMAVEVRLKGAGRDHAASARAAVLARMVPDWQRIETAPKDGTVVDLFTDQGNRLTNRQWLTGAQRDPERCGPGRMWEHLRMDGWAIVGSKEGCGCMIEKHITHWRPVPADPVPQARP